MWPSSSIVNGLHQKAQDLVEGLTHPQNFQVKEPLFPTSVDPLVFGARRALIHGEILPLTIALANSDPPLKVMRHRLQLAQQGLLRASGGAVGA
jgi:hypothetical protein